MVKQKMQNNVEANFACKEDDYEGLIDITNLDVADFFEHHN
ncbi:hypothetical protein G2W53_014153 [Senna tora]|uniref:Uncharacterized protein n=1 Tax=Senna tora TaxID=362788 RepID=A0A834WSZ4_9FABA|nr:hypothetical protein G2W53_014153 [Senna tora]